MTTFTCPVSECHRRFNDEPKLQEHLRRRHNSNFQNLRDISNQEIESQPQKKIDRATLEKTKKELLAQEKEMQSELNKLDEQEEEEVKLSMNDILESKKRLTAEYLLEKSGSDNLEDITQLILRDQNLSYFDDTPKLCMDQLFSVEYLSISHNKISVVSGINKLANLIELNINFNIVDDITPLNECLNLEKLYASNNKIRNISGIRDLTRLKCLGLFKNKIHNFDETVSVLSGFPDLKELDLDGNPCTRKFTYKYDLLYYVRVEKLDGERTSEIDFELAKSFKLKNASDEGDLREESKSNPLQRPSTAPGRVQPRNFTERWREKVHEKNNVPLGFITENVDTERLAELEQENEMLKDRLNLMETELEEVKARENSLQLENNSLNNQIKILKVEANNAYILMDNNQQLSKELHSLKAVFGNKSDPQNEINLVRDFKQDNFLLQEQIEELLKENRELKLKNERRGPQKDSTTERDSAKKITLPNIKKSGNQSETVDQESKTETRRTPMSPKTAIIKTNKKSIVRTSRGASVERKDSEEGKGGSTVLDRSKIIIRVPSRQGTPRQSTPSRQKEEEIDDEPLDSEIEELLMRSSFQLQQMRSDLKDMAALSNSKGKNYDDEVDVDDNENPNYDDERETQDTSVRVESTPMQGRRLR